MAKTKVKLSILKNIKTWIRENRVEALLLILILLVGGIFRLYKINQYMTFLGDEGRDVIVVRRLLTNFDPILVGPGTSIGNMYLGPIYYYMMAPALLLGNFSPVGPAVMIALLGIATIFFVWYLAREWFPSTRLSANSGLRSEQKVPIAGLVAAGLYAITPVVIIYSRSSWNPNIMPFFALLTIYSVWQFWQKQKFAWITVSGVSMAFVLQSHYLGLLLTPVIGFFWLITLIRLGVKRSELNKFKPATRNSLTHEQKNFLKYSILSFLFFVLLMSPLVIFDARHGWRNFEAMKTFFTQRQTTVSARPWTALPKLPEIAAKMITRLVAGANVEVGMWLSYLFLAVLIVILIFVIYNFLSRKVFTKSLSAYLILIVWIGAGLVGLALYKQEIYDHYYGFLFAAPFLLIGGISQRLIDYAKNIGFAAVVLSVGLLIYINLSNNPLKFAPNKQLQTTQEVAKAVVNYSEGKPFNFAVIAERNYEGAYLYFFQMWGIPAKIAIADKLNETLTDQLFVVCEVSADMCNPETNDRPELTNFGWRKEVASWNVSGVTIHKIIHAQ